MAPNNYMHIWLSGIYANLRKAIILSYFSNNFISLKHIFGHTGIHQVIVHTGIHQMHIIILWTHWNPLGAPNYEHTGIHQVLIIPLLTQQILL
jgi:hypothetical protein